MRRFALAILVACSIAPISAQMNGEREPDRPIDKAGRDQLVERINADLNRSYIYPAKAAEMGKYLENRHKSGAYEKITSSKEFAETLTNDLQSVSHDRHLRVFYNFDPLPEMHGGEPPVAERERMRREMAQTNFGFERVEILDGNVGYLDLRGFVPLELAKEKAIAAMRLLSDTDALIIDLRKNGGGAPDMVAFVCSYFFGNQRVHLNDLYWRERNNTDEWWTTPDVPGPKYLDKPVYLLTSRRTFSAAEEFTYDLQNQKRVTIVGETTGGGAHPGGPERLNEHFVVWIPRGRAINPVTKTDWEGTGVIPDVKTDQASALKTAHMAAVEKILAKTTHKERQAALRDILAEIKKD